MKQSFSFLIYFIALFTYANKPYITNIYDYVPAPGQFVNRVPAYEDGYTKQDMLSAVASCICGYEDSRGDTIIADGMISLGAFGGYVVFGFDHPIVNHPGEYDFKVLGNAFAGEGNGGAAASCEPGVVMVSRDNNANGIPDDTWYEIAGSEYNNPRTKHDYEITYYRPLIGDDWEYSSTQVRWTSNDTDSLSEGYIDNMARFYHYQTYWPMWLRDSTTLTFKCTKLPNNAYDFQNNGLTFKLRYFDWGYVDNITNGEDPGIKIDWAVDVNGNYVHLDKVDFVKVYTGVNQKLGNFGETSTEIAGAYDLHPNMPLLLVGDVNNDGYVDISDVVLLSSYIMGDDVTMLGFVIEVADCNYDGIVDISDLTFLANMI